MGDNEPHRTRLDQMQVVETSEPHDEAWAGITDPKLRRRLQNRVNQRESRRRRAEEREAVRNVRSIAQKSHGAAQPTAARAIIPKLSHGASHTEDPWSLSWSSLPSWMTGDSDSPLPNPGRPQSTALKRIEAGSRTFVPFSYFRNDLPRSPEADALPGSISCVIDAKRIWHYALTILLPTLGVKTRSGAPLHEALYHSASLEPVVFYATLTGGAAQRLTVTQSPDDARVFLIAQSKTAEAVRASLGKGILTNGTLFAIMSLALKQNQYSTSLPVEKRYPGAFSSPVRNIGGLNWLGQLQYAPEHASMWPKLLRSRSSGITHPGLNDYLQLSDLYRASLSLTRPEMELQARVALPWDDDAIHFPQLWELEDFQAHSELKDIVLDMRLCCRLIKNITERGDDPDYFIRHRNSVQHQLLCLPQDRDKLALFITMIFSYGAIFPISDPQPLGRLTKKLCCALSDPLLVASHSEKFLLWVSVIGGIAAWGGEHQKIFTVLVSKQAKLIGVSNWGEVVPILENFLWLDQACDAGGRLVWECALADMETSAE